MIINNITPIHRFNTVKQTKNNNGQSQISLHSQPSCDTVSFSGKIPKSTNTFFMEALGRYYDITETKLVSRAKEFHDTLKRVTERLKAFGFDYDETYNAANPIKKKKSFMDKYERQGNVQDVIRGTIYWQDQQDVLAFKKYIDEMKKEGWEISQIKKFDPQTGEYIRNKKGTIIKYPDLEIRQNGITTESLAPLGELLQRAEISRPRTSTYADWQVRFVLNRDKGIKGCGDCCEVIFLYGPHYKDAKELEHKFVYEPSRNLKKLHIDKNPEHHPKNSAGYIIASNIEEINRRLVQFVSQPLFTNAFNADLKIKDAVKIPVEISPAYGNLIINYARSISKSLSAYYSQMSKELLTQEQVVNAIKESPTYLIKEDKAISAKEIKAKKTEIKKRLAQWQEADNEIINNVIIQLKETIERFGAKN